MKKKKPLRFLLALTLLATLLLPSCMPRNDSIPSQNTQNDTAATQRSPETEQTAQTPETVPASPRRMEPDAHPDADARARMRLDACAEKIVAYMSVEQKTAQLFVVTPEQLSGQAESQTETDAALEEGFAKIPVGGVICMGGNIRSPEQAKALCSGLNRLSQEQCGLPLLLCVDEEGGTVARITGHFGYDEIPDMSDVGETGDRALARDIGTKIGGYLRELGFNVDFAPDADVLTNPQNRVVKYRSFGADAALVTDMARAYAEGLASQGILATYKHYPGHGATAEDSHEGFAISDRTQEELENRELQPFYDAVEAEIPLIMAGHILLPRVTAEDLPASLSHELLTEQLRGRMGYKGLIITDALNMGAITQNYGQEEAMILALQAGNDLLLMPPDLESCHRALTDAVLNGEISQWKLDTAVRRIVRCKLQNLSSWDTGINADLPTG